MGKLTHSRTQSALHGFGLVGHFPGFRLFPSQVRSTKQFPRVTFGMLILGGLLAAGLVWSMCI
jgi:hypothetical protein